MDLNATAIGAMPGWWPSDVQTGLFLFILGITGAMIMVFIGGWDRLMARNARIIEIEEEIKEKREIASKLKDDKTEDRQKWEEMINGDEDRLDKERNFYRSMGVILYLLIGGVVATVMATNMIEAFAFGAGWTAIIGVFGIKKDEENQEKLKEKMTKEKEEDVKELKANFTNIKDKAKEAYYDGYSAAIEKIAEAQKVSVEDIINKIKPKE